MKVLCILLNYKTADMSLRALEALLAEIGPIEGASVAVVDNASGDGSFERLSQAVRERGWNDRVEVIASPVNGGFGAGNNFAIRRNLASAHPADYFYLLNSDAFPDAGSVQALLSVMQARPECGIAGSYIHGPDGEPHTTAFRFPSVLSELEAGLGLGLATRLLARWVVPMPMPETTTEVDWLAGASMMVRREVWQKAGLFDEAFFLYFEETDLCRRAKQHGYSTVYVVDSHVTHIGSVSTGMKNKQRRIPRFWLDSRQHYFAKNHGVGYLWLANAAWAGSFALWSVRAKLQRKPNPHPPKLFTDFVTHSLFAHPKQATTARGTP